MKKILLLISSLSFLFACSEESLQTDYKIVEEKRTLLFYLAGDNNLSFEIKNQREALRKGWNAQTMGKLIVVSDDNIEGKPILETLTTRKGQNTWDTLKVYKNADSASPAVLKSAIADMQTYAPARHYGFITFSHATGWLPKGTFENPYKREIVTRSLLVDNDNEMEFDDFAAAIPNQLFDFMIFDMCFMAGIESTYALRNKTPYILASSAEILSPGLSAIYTNSLSKLYTTAADLKGFAKDFFNYFSALQPPYKSATISVINTAPVERLATAVKELTIKELSQEQINELQFFDRKTPHLFFDFADYYRKAAPASEQVKLNSILDEVIVYKAHTERLINIDIKKHSGLSIYVPQTGLHQLNEAFEQTVWRKFLSN